MNLAYSMCNAICNAFVDLLDSGNILFHNTAHSSIGVCPMNAAAYSSAVTGVATMAVSPAVTDATTMAGTVEHAHLQDANDALLAKMTCGVDSEEFVFSSLTFALNDTITITACTVTWAGAVIT